MKILEYATLNGSTYVATCGDCGWRSSAHGTQSSAIGVAHHHAGECDQEPAEETQP